MTSHDFDTTVLENEAVADGLFRLRFSAPAGTPAPGQFVMVRIGDRHDPLLRRPFSIHAATGSEWRILYRVVGKGTRWLADRRPGDPLRVLGPLGTGFPLQVDGAPLLIGGGIGAAPLPLLAEKLLEASGEPPRVVIGFRTAAEIVCAEDFRRLGCPLTVVTEDGSSGEQGLVTDWLPDDPTVRPFLYVCGPMPMMRAVARIAADRRWPGVVSLETMMACGISACLGCAVPAATGASYLHACKDGPVLPMEAIQWDAI